MKTPHSSLPAPHSSLLTPRSSLLCLLLSFLICLSCSRGGDVSTPQSAAVYYVEQLSKGNYEAWLGGMQSLDHASADYRNHQLVLLKQLMAKQAQKPTRIEATDCDIYGDTVADVYLRLTWEGDSAETVLLPLQLDGDKWRLY